MAANRLPSRSMGSPPIVLFSLGVVYERHASRRRALAAPRSRGATINCTNKGGNLVESHTANFSASSTASVASTKNGQLSVPAQSASPFSAPQVCPNPNWTPSIAPGTLVLNEFTYTLTFAGFSSPAVLITASDP